MIKNIYYKILLKNKFNRKSFNQVDFLIIVILNSQFSNFQILSLSKYTVTLLWQTKGFRQKKEIDYSGSESEDDNKISVSYRSSRTGVSSVLTLYVIIFTLSSWSHNGNILC